MCVYAPLKPSLNGQRSGQRSTSSAGSAKLQTIDVRSGRTGSSGSAKLQMIDVRSGRTRDVVNEKSYRCQCERLSAQLSARNRP